MRPGNRPRRLSALPGWRIDVPGHPDEAEAMLRAAAGRTDRTYIRLSGLANQSAFRHLGDVGSERLTVVRRGRGATVVAVGRPLTRSSTPSSIST
jgi:transketolase